MSHTTAHAAPHAQDEGHQKSWALLAVALAAQILVVLDISVVNTALPTIGRSLDMSGGDLQWLVTAYLMMSGGGLLLGGRISDLLSRRGVFLTGLALFTTASLVSGFADTGSQLVAARAVQGLSAALLTPSALALIMTTYAGAQRKAALAMWGAVGSLGVAAGVLLGGAVTTWASWQFIFWINGPVGLVALIVGHRVIAKQPVTRPRLTDFDVPGAAAVIAALATLIYALGGTATHGWWSAQTVAALGVCCPPGGDLPAARAARGQAAVPPARVAAQGPRVRHRRHARCHGHPGRRRLPVLDLPADRARVLRPRDRARLPAVRPRHHRRHRRRPAPARPRVPARHRHDRAADRRRRRRSCWPPPPAPPTTPPTCSPGCSRWAPASAWSSCPSR